MSFGLKGVGRDHLSSTSGRIAGGSSFPKMSASGGSDVLVTVGIVGNILSVVGVVIMNKYITEVDGYNFMVFLSFLHFAFTSIGCRLMMMADFFSWQAAPFSGVLPVAIGSLLSVAFMNLNLASNSVGFYQLSKLICIPVTLWIQYVAYNTTVSRAVQVTLIPITFGVGYATVYDLEIRFVGFVFAACAVFATAIAQIFTNVYQKSLDCNALQLLHHTSPLIAVGMLIMCPFFDDLTSLVKYQYHTWGVIRIVVSCIFALGVNISNYLVLGKTSPLTYQVLGHLKTVLILILGFVFFNKHVDMRNVLGIIIAMVGVIAYTEVRRRQSMKPVLPTSASKHNLGLQKSDEIKN